ncbi:hypothetical protein D9M72_341720 [compost metagenome]
MDREVAVGLVDGDLCQPGQQFGAAVRGNAGLEQLGALVDEGGGHIAGNEVLVVQDGLQEGNVGGDAADAELREGSACPGHCCGVVAAAAGQFDQHGVEVRADFGTRVDGAAVEPYTGAAGGTVTGDLSDVGPEAVGRILGGDAALQCGALELDSVLRKAKVSERFARRDTQLCLDEVHIGDFLGDSVLHLDARVHLDEHVLAGAFADGVHQELHGAGVDVVEGLGELHRIPVQRLTDAFIQVRRRRDLDHLLMAALDGAVAFEEMHDVAVGIGQDLDLDVAGAENGLLQEHGGITESGVGLAHGGLQRFRESLAGVHAAHAAASAAGYGLGEDGEADFVRCGDQFIQVLGGLARPEDGYAGGAGSFERGDLVSGQLKDLGRRANKGDAGLFGGPGQAGVLREEAIAGVDGIGAGFLGHADHFVHVKVSPDWVALFADQVRFISLLAVDGVSVLVGEHGNSLGAQLVAGTEGTDRDFAAVSHQNFGKHTSPASLRVYR